MADVFLSHARPNADAAQRIANSLRDAGYSVWYDESLPAHRPYSDVIAEQLDAASAILVLWSKQSAASHWVRSEANRGLETGRLVQLRLDDARLPMPFDQIQCADLQRWRGDTRSAGWLTIIGSIAALTGNESAGLPLPSAPGQDRRALLLGGAALAVVAAGGGAYFWDQRPPRLSPEAALLLQKGMDALQANDALDPEDEGTTAQAIALLTDATGLAPQSAPAWGGLALAYAARRRAAAVEERVGLEVRGRAAAQTALKLDAREPRALAALRLLSPVYRNWANAEREARQALAKNPDFPILLFVLSDVLSSVGRLQEATGLSNRLDRSKFLLPGAERKAIINLWASGDLQAADRAIRDAAQRWPKHRQIWRTQVAYLLYSGQAAEALAVLTDADARPVDLPADVVEAATATAKALTGQIDVRQAVTANLTYLRDNPARALQVAQACTAMGDVETAFQLLDGYYFNAGPWSLLAPAAGDSGRQTAALFQPPMKSLRLDARFEPLLSRIGLTRYWEQTRTTPDYRATDRTT